MYFASWLAVSVVKPSKIHGKPGLPRLDKKADDVSARLVL